MRPPPKRKLETIVWAYISHITCLHHCFFFSFLAMVSPCKELDPSSWKPIEEVAWLAESLKASFECLWYIFGKHCHCLNGSICIAKCIHVLGIFSSTGLIQSLVCSLLYTQFCQENYPICFMCGIPYSLKKYCHQFSCVFVMCTGDRMHVLHASYLQANTKYSARGTNTATLKATATVKILLFLFLKYSKYQCYFIFKKNEKANTKNWSIFYFKCFLKMFYRHLACTKYTEKCLINNIFIYSDTHVIFSRVSLEFFKKNLVSLHSTTAFRKELIK